MSLKPPSVSVTLDAVRPSLESALFVLADLTFTSSESVRLKVESYRLQWPGGDLVVKPKDLTVEAGQSVQRTLRVEATAGDLQQLLFQHPTRASVRVERARRG